MYYRRVADTGRGHTLNPDLFGERKDKEGTKQDYHPENIIKVESEQRQYKKNLNRALKELSTPIIFWSEADVPTRRQLLHLLFDDKIILSEGFIIEKSMTWQAQAIYGLSTAVAIKEPGSFESFNEGEEFNSELQNRIRKYEQSRNIEISPESAQNIADFIINIVLLNLRIL